MTEPCADPLRKIYLEITTDCNLACPMCIRHVWQEATGAMSRATFARLLAQLPALPSVQTLSFSGFGEATVHPDFLDFVAAAKRAGLRAELVTNGLRLRGALAEKLVELGLDRLVVSMDSAVPCDDGLLHGPEEVHRAVQDNLRSFQHLRTARRAERTEVGLHFVATRSNIQQLPALWSLSRELGFSSITVSNLVPHQPGQEQEILYRRWTTARRSRGTSPWNPVIDLPRLDVRSPASPVLDTLQARGAHLRIAGHDLAGGGMHCRFVAEGCVTIGPDGGVSPCLPLLHTHSYYYDGRRRQVRQYTLGSIQATPLAEIWNSDVYRAFRQRVRRFEFSPCIDCGGCDMRQSNQVDCSGDEPPRCGACLWAAGVIQCP